MRATGKMESNMELVYTLQLLARPREASGLRERESHGSIETTGAIMLINNELVSKNIKDLALYIT